MELAILNRLLSIINLSRILKKRWRTMVQNYSMDLTIKPKAHGKIQKSAKSHRDKTILP